MKLQLDKRRVLKALVALARRLGRSPSRREFIGNTGIPLYAVLRFFPGWNAAVRAAGLAPYTENQRHEDRELLEDWGRAARENGKCPSVRAYDRLGKFASRTLVVRLGSWLRIPEAFRRFARGKPEWADVLALLPPPAPTPPKRQPPSTAPSPLASDHARALPQPPAELRHPQLPGHPIYGRPLDFRGLRHEPTNEQGVVLLFGMVARELGYIVEAVQAGFPDCEAKRQVAPERWQRVHLEFEYESRNFRSHGHPLKGCDVIVCWRHNWPTCPDHLEVLELSSLIRSLPHS